MAGVARKAPAKRKAKSPSPRQKVLQSSWVDMLIRALPLSEQDVQRIITWIILAAFTLLAFVAAQYAGLTAAAYQQYAALAAKAGFEVQRVEVTGMERVDQLKVYQLVLAEKDRAMPLVDIDKVRADLLQYGWIKDARVSRQLPNTLAVEIIERKPAAIWQRNGKYSLIDANGIVLANVRAGEGGDLPTLNGIEANTHIVALNALLDNASALKSQVSGATWIGNRRWDLQFQTGETLALPEGEAEAAKALLNFARLDGVHRLLGRDLIHFDLRDPNRAYFRKAPKAEPTKVQQAEPVKVDNKDDNKNNEITKKNNGLTA
ncbi:cell division protein FtsQ/DivIB [Sphingorhabdus wooponensis]|jgi:cell division protein FtsQ|uniref:Cell division protein FtsQ n=1 Tax=Sphingorhabdus wooponensis TaxID=940136 RepID=A0A426RSF6_9SPHN|nr:cell division protein FtsQ/DivIB [Sphingorhabdus wooponensis]RRQ51935.1 FtsQ-type POTRA domain-containing protein [Sphingorhabdus wooponensis]